MADSERFKTGGDEPIDPAQRRDELDQLLQRIAAHIAEVDKAASVQPGASGGDAAASSHETRAEATSPDDLGRAHEAPSETPIRAQEGHDEAVTDAGDEPWDSETAEALTRSYETDASVPPLRSMLNLMAQRQADSGQVEPRAAGRSASTVHGEFSEFSNAEIDAAQTRLFEAARRVETMLDRLAPREAVEALGHRFQALEGEVRRSGDQLARLDGIEQRLGELGQKLTDEQVLNLFGTLVPTAEELTQFAEDAAGRAAERVLEAYARDIAPEDARAAPEADASSAIGGELASLGARLGAYMDERRRNDASTVEALETLQLAMQHVLDRIDGVEGRVEPERAQPVEASGASGRVVYLDRPAAGMVPPHEEPSDQFGTMEAGHRDLDDASEGMINLTANQATGAPDLTAESYSMPASVLRDATRPGGMDGLGEQHTASQDPADPLPQGLRHAEGAHAVPPPMPPRHEPAPEVTDEDRAQSDRQRLIAMARKAAERANAQSSQPVRGKVEEPKSPSVAIKRSIFGAASSTGIIRPGVLIVAIAAIALAGYWLLYGQKNGLLRSFTSVSIEQPQSVAMVYTDGTPPEARAGDGVLTDNAGTADRVSVQVAVGAAPAEAPSSAPSVSQHEAGADTVAGDASGPGMAISFGNSPASAEAVMRARERARIASLSQRAAFSAAVGNIRDAAPLPAAANAMLESGQESPVETSSVSGKGVPAPGADTATGSQGVQQLDLPPATTGPLSLRLAAAKGDAAAQLEIATRLAEGRGVRQNFAEAARWYERSANQGHAVAQYRLATLYERGMGVKADRKAAQALYEKAAAQGNLKAMHNLAVISASPAVGVPDYITAARLFSLAAQHGLHDSQYNLGVLYESGLGVPKDHGAAYKWYSLAARGGDTVAARRRDMLISRLPRETLQAMDAQIAGWQAAPANAAANNTRMAGSAWAQSGAQMHR